MTKLQEQQIEKFITGQLASAKYWSKVDRQTCEEKIRGFFFSLLVELDGGAQSDGYDLIDIETGENLSIGHLHEIMNNYE